MAGISAAQLAEHAAGLSDVPGAVLAVHPSLASPGRLAGLLRHGRRAGFVVEDMTDVDDFSPIEGVWVPDVPLYLVLDPARGDELRNTSPIEALAALRSAGRTPLTLNEGISWLLQQTESAGAGGVLHDDRIPQGHRVGGGCPGPGDLDQSRHRPRRPCAP